MTTSIYYLLMSLTLFILPQLAVRFVVGAPVWDKRVRFLLYSALLPSLWYVFVPHELNHIREINFLQHALGGVSAGLVAVFFINIFQEKYNEVGLWSNFIFQISFVYVCVSAFGVANELLEFLLDWAEIGVFSADRYDVWFDLTANTLGAFAIFLTYNLFQFILKRDQANK